MSPGIAHAPSTAGTLTNVTVWPFRCGQEGHGRAANGATEWQRRQPILRATRPSNKVSERVTQGLVGRESAVHASDVLVPKPAVPSACSPRRIRDQTRVRRRSMARNGRLRYLSPRNWRSWPCWSCFGPPPAHIASPYRCVPTSLPGGQRASSSTAERDPEPVETSQPRARYSCRTTQAKQPDRSRGDRTGPTANCSIGRVHGRPTFPFPRQAL